MPLGLVDVAASPPVRFVDMREQAQLHILCRPVEPFGIRVLALLRTVLSPAVRLEGLHRVHLIEFAIEVLTAKAGVRLLRVVASAFDVGSPEVTRLSSCDQDSA